MIIDAPFFCLKWNIWCEYMLLWLKILNSQVLYVVLNSSQKLEIDRGWLQKIDIANYVEDEKHLIFNYSSYNMLRFQFFKKVQALCKNFTNLSQDAQLIWLMNNESDDIINLFSWYISDCFKLRNC